MTTRALRFLVGAALLFLGRQLYWLFVAGVGFLMAMDLVPRLAQVDSTLVVLIIALAAGLVGALLAVLLQKAAIAIAGFFAGGYAMLTLVRNVLGLETTLVTWALILVGAILAGTLILVLFNGALIVLSSLTGAWLITQGLDPAGGLMTRIAFLVLVATGILIQAGLSRRRPSAKRRNGPSGG